MRTESNPTIEVRNVVHRYKQRVALDDISLTIEAGSATAVVGPDGVGKSTLLALMAGVRQLQSGDVRVLGGTMRSGSHRNRISQRIAYMPQGLGRNLYPSLSISENLDFFGRLFGANESDRTRRIARLFEATGLEPFADRPAGKLSGGMKQKLSLCTALIHDPDVLILDEPTTGIDPLSRRQFWSLIDGLKHERPTMTVVVSTAYIEEAERFERIVAMDAGRLLVDGTATEILTTAGAGALEDAFLSLRDPGRPVRPRQFALAPRPRSTGPPVIEAEGLTRCFGDFVAVDHVDFSIERGEIFGFLGSNGCGKTTTMKMLTGLLPASEGRAQLLGRPVEASDIETRLRIGYMSQSFSLYEELSVRTNLELHACLYRIARSECPERVEQALARFDLVGVADQRPKNLPLGLRQRLQLAAACLHRPDVLILDEPTSGVDPEARDMFWVTLQELSRDEGVTIFLSTHFMKEAERCDRVSLMHAGKVLAVGTPRELAQEIGVASLEEAFVAHIEQAMPDAVAHTRSAEVRVPVSGTLQTARLNQEANIKSTLASSVRRVGAFARREALELSRDPIRIAFALLGPLSLLITLGYGINFDVNKLPFAVLDRDRTAESRQLIQDFAASRYFDQRPAIAHPSEVDSRLESGEIRFVMSIPPRFGKDIVRERHPDVAFFLDGANTFRAETVRGYIEGTMLKFSEQGAKQSPARRTEQVPVRLEQRFRYNQKFESATAIVPGSIMVIMVLIPAMMAALGVVREREIGSISNLYASPGTTGEFLIGKQLPYLALSYVSFISLILIAVAHFELSINGSIAALLLGGLLYVFATTALGLLVSSFVTTQIAALIAAAVICVVPSLQFSGFLYPAATLEGFGYYMGHGFPSLWFQNVVLGTFAKGQDFTAFFDEFAILCSFGIAFLVAARLVLRKQEL